MVLFHALLANAPHLLQLASELEKQGRYAVLQQLQHPLYAPRQHHFANEHYTLHDSVQKHDL